MCTPAAPSHLPPHMLTNNLLTHNLSTQLPHIQLTHTQLAHTQLAHTQLTHKQLGHTPSLCVASVALGDIDRHFAWQACTLYGTGLALVARLGRSGRPLSPRLLAWQAWHFATSTLAGVARNTTCPHNLSTHNLSTTVARMALGYWAGSGGALGPEWPGWPPRLLAWQAWHFATFTLVSRGRRGTW